MELNNEERFPIGMVINGGSTAQGPTYDVVDMRDGDVLFSSDLAAKAMTPIIAELNFLNRKGHYEEDFDLIRKHAETLCRGLDVMDNTAELGDLSHPEVEVVAAPAEVMTETTTDNSAAMPSWTPPAMPALPTIN